MFIVIYNVLDFVFVRAVLRGALGMGGPLNDIRGQTAAIRKIMAKLPW